MSLKMEAASLSEVKDRIRDHEGFSIKPYVDTLGYTTGGVGHKILPSEEVPTTEKGWLKLYDQDFDKAVAAADEITPDDIHPTAFGIITEMIFQLGKQGCMNFKKMHKALAEKDHVEASMQMLDSKWRKQTKARCESLAELMRSI
ncbi:lysozyme [uncultured Mediterranean phage uvMED]|nr:lysozyme [uncultured Mediterranean phage uvMED]BAR37076.1 Phage-related lysozyme (muraminidase) (COG3772) [uncultured Mediterranean phage uvMED]